METQIKIYKPLCMIKMKDGAVLFAPLEAMDAIHKDLNDKDLAFVKIEGRITNKFSVDYVDEYIPTDDIDVFFGTVSRQDREALKLREKDKMAKVWKWFASIDEAAKRLENHKKAKQDLLKSWK